MSSQPPIDPRKRSDIVAQARQLAGLYTPEWTPREGNPADALVHLFARLMEIVIDRLNRVPEKHFLAFLDAAGVTPLPPKAARAPVKFLLAAKATQDGFVPKGTSLATAIKDQPPVTFETEKDLIVVRAQLAAAFVHTPQADTYGDGAPVLEADTQNDKTRLNLKPFEGDTLVPHRLYLSHDTLFAVSAKTRVEIGFSFNNPAVDSDFFNQQVQWHCKTAGEDQPLTSSLGEDGHTVVFEDLSGIEAWPVGDKTAYWIWCQCKVPLNDRLAQMGVETITCQTNASHLVPDFLFYNAAALDPAREFYPFGQRPKRYDTFFIACREAFSKAGSRITLQPDFSAGETTSVELQWEFWNGERWEILGASTQSNASANDTAYNFRDDTLAFTASGPGLQVQFDCPLMGEAEINGRKNVWLRVRLIDGDYGKEAQMTLTGEGEKLEPEARRLSHWVFHPEHFTPPVITALTVDYGFETPLAPENLATENNFIIEGHTPGQPFAPFATDVETRPAFYLGLDPKPTGGQPVSLYLSVARTAMDAACVVGWTYWTGNGWKRLAVSDDTRNLTESGIVAFTAPADFAAAARFTDATPRHWIRLTLESGDPTDVELAGVYLNTVWARHAVTIRNEMLGSSKETPGAIFKLASVPVLADQQIEVLEPEPPSAEELADLIKEEGQSVLTAADRPTLGSSAVWVRWHAVDDFRLSGSKSRHYMIARGTGRITFGDGVRGMVPPAGRDNIRARVYASGGEAKGNVPARTIAVLKRAIASIDGVFNVAAAGGGSAMESDAALVERGPRSLKHRGRSVTWEDYEWLAGEASFQVARARCLPASGAAQAGRVTLIIVPESDDDRPFPDQGLIRQVRQYLQTTMIPTAALLIDGPQYIRVAITATVFPEQPEQADFVRGRVEERLRGFFHPLKGGPEQKGWAFGRDVHISEVCGVIEDTPGVHHAEDVAICSAFYEDGTAVVSTRSSMEDDVALLEHVAVGEGYLVASGSHWITVPGASAEFPVDEAPFIANTRTREIHNINRLQPNCHIPDIREEHKKQFLCLSSALRQGYDFCAWCFGRQYSLR